jgi:phospholipid/cholesterol/gamma-HCH transport system permease protein
MVTARGASATAAELGNMRVTEQIDALTTLGVSPVQYLIVPRVLASVLMMPLLCVLYTCVGMLGATAVAILGLDIDYGTYIARIEAGVQLRDFTMGMVKAVVFGFIVAMIACIQGFNASGGAKGVGEATTRAVVQSAVATLIANYVLTSLMTDL